MEGNIILIVILLTIGIVAAQVILRRLFNRGTNAVERAIRTDAAKQTDDLLSTIVIFETSAPPASIRQSIENNVPVINKIGHMMKVLENNDNCVKWSIGMPNAGNGAAAELIYTQKYGGIIAVFQITRHVTQGTVSPFINQLMELRNQVITAFKTVDSKVKITADKQEVVFKMGWFFPDYVRTV